MIEITGEEAMEQHLRRSREFLGKAENELWQELFRTNRDCSGDSGSRRNARRYILQHGKAYRNLHLLFGREEERERRDPSIAEHGKEMPERRFIGIRQAFGQQ